MQTDIQQKDEVARQADKITQAFCDCDGYSVAFCGHKRRSTKPHKTLGCPMCAEIEKEGFCPKCLRYFS